MATRSSESDFLIKIGKEFSWRKKELILLSNRIPLKESSIQKVLLRSSIALIYAHWEGFVKVSMSLYLKYVSEQYLSHNQLKNSFITLSLSRILGDLNNNSIRTRTKLIETLLSKLNSRSRIPSKNIIQTKSNLKYKVLEEIMFILDLDDTDVKNKRDLIDDLVDLRNCIAHGSFQNVSYSVCLSLNTDILNLMDSLKTLIENNAVNKGYLK